ncbi:Trophinin [Holothuria leucospilota]|uniref:Trophinin n=1 Tax=Holothuria leucospilota TaxID=206669 RepID=A0A9Q1H850_HOLLE|nr:Trophinin [Holothuria leucospilota]
MTVNPTIVLLLLLGVIPASTSGICGDQGVDMCHSVPLARHRAFSWLLKEHSVSMQPGEQFDLNQMVTMLSLQLAYPNFLAELQPHERDYFRSVQESSMLSALARAKANQRKGDIVPYLDPLHFAQQLLAMEASCIDTKSFFDQNLQRHLSILTRDYPEANYEDLFQFAYSLLPLCSTNFKFYEKAWLKLLRVRDRKRPCVIVPRDEFDGTDKQHEAFTVATLSMLVMTMRCARNQVPEKHREIFFERFYQRAECIAGWQNKSNYGFGGNLKITALALQALNAAGVDQSKWNCSGALHHVLQAQHLDGSFGRTTEETALALLVLANRHLGGLWEADVECPDGRNRHNLPGPIGPFDSRKTFTLVLYNEIRNTHRYHNITIIDGENLLQALIRAKMDENIDFDFTAERFTYNDEEGIYLTSVNGWANDGQRFYHWFAKKYSEEKEGNKEDQELLSLDKIEPDEDSKIILAYKDITPKYLRPPELPRPITKDDEYFNLTIKVTNEITGTESFHYTPVIEGETLLEALVRAWGHPWSTFNFAAVPAQIFNKNGVFLASVNGVEPDKENCYFWVVKDENEDYMKEKMGKGSFQPKGLLEYKPKDGHPVNLAYVDLSDYKDQMNPSGKGERELPKNIEDGDSKIVFTLNINNSITERIWSYNVTIIEGENLLDAFLRGWRDIDMFPSFGADVFPFFGKQSLYITSINGVANDRENLYHWIVKEDVMPSMQMAAKEFMPIGLTEVIPEDGEEIHVVYTDLSPWKEQLLMFLDGNEVEMRMEQGMMGLKQQAQEMGMHLGETPREVRDCDTTLNITIVVANNITQEHEGFNLTIIEGENLQHALLRAWKDPEINFNFAVEPFIVFDKPGLYLKSVNGLANNPEEYTLWLVKLADEEQSMSNNFEPMDTQFVPRNWDKVVLLYADLIDWKDQLEQIKAELPPRIQQGDETVTFTLYLINEMRQEHSGFNVTILEGETLLDGLHRAWKNKSNFFNFGAEPFEFLGKNGVFLTTVNGIANSRIDNYHWVVKQEKSEEVRLIDYEPTALNKLKPTDGSVIKLVYADISKVIEEKRRHYARGEFPRFMRRSDDIFTMSLVVYDNITGEHSLYNVKAIKGENLLHTLLRAWKDPYHDFNFAAKPGNLFNKEGIYLSSVNGKSNDPDQCYQWLVKDVPKCDDPRTMMMMNDSRRMDGMMMRERQMSPEVMIEDSFEPYGLEEYIPDPRKVVQLVYTDLSPWKNRSTPSGLGMREFPEMIKEGDDSIKFTLYIYNSETERLWSYNMTILKGESLFEAFLRMWKKPEIDFQFSAQPFAFFGKHGLFITSINGISNNRETQYHWIIKANGKKADTDKVEESEMFKPVGLTDFIPMDGGEAHVAYVNLREQIMRFREERGVGGEIMQQGLEMEIQGMMEREGDEGMGHHGEIPRDITACDLTADITVYVVNNITQTKESFNLTIIEGERLAHALVRAWRDPDINFNFAAAPFIFFHKLGLYLTSVNGLANNKEDYTYWLIKRADEEVEGPIGLQEWHPKDGDKVILIYADLSAYKDDLQAGKEELPRPIEDDDVTATFTLYTIDTLRQEHKGYNITILEGETILDGLHRAWKSWDSYFNFGAAPFRFVNKRGVFLTSVNGVRNSRETLYHWLLLDGDADPSRKIPPSKFEPTALNEVKPTDGSVFKLVYLDLTPVFSREQDPLELPREIFDDDDTFTLHILVGDNITGNHSIHNATVIRGEPLIHGLLRAWKAPSSNFNFDTAVFKFFDKVDYFPTSVLGVANDIDKNYYWIVADSEPEDGMMDSNFQPIGLSEYIPREGVPVKLIYIDLSPWMHDLNPTGEGRHELPKDIEDGASTVNFTLNVFNDILQRNWRYEVTILEGENLLDAFLRLWKDAEVDFNFGATAFHFANKFACFVYNINGLANQPENYFHWIVLGEVNPKNEGQRRMDELNPVGLREVVPTNGGEVHVVYKDLSSYREHLARGGRMEMQGMAGGMMAQQGMAGGLMTQQRMAGGMMTQQGMAGGMMTQQGMAGGVMTQQGMAGGMMTQQGMAGGMMTQQGMAGGMMTQQGMEYGMRQGMEYGMREGMEGGMMADSEEYHGLPREIKDDDRTVNITIYVVNNITQTHEGFNVTILWGERLIHALLRAWKDPEINFNFASKPLTFLGKYGVFLTSVNGLANNYTNLHYWLVTRGGDYSEEPWGLLEYVPRPDDKIILVYSDLSQHEDSIKVRELPPDIQDGDETVDFTLYVLNNITKQHCAYNVSVLPGEDLLDGLFRAWKDPELYFNFAAAAFTIFDKYAVYLLSVNGVHNDQERGYHWLAEIARTPEEKMGMMMDSTEVMEYQPWGLIEFIPTAGTDIKLIYADLTPLVQERQMMQAMQGEPGSNRNGNQGGNQGGNPRGS